MKTITIIPAKSNSNRLPGKNKKKLNGTELFLHTYNHAKKSEVCGDIYVATDDKEIEKLALDVGALVPFSRDKNDTDDFTSVGEACFNFLKRVQIEFGKTYDIVCILLTTSPLRKIEDIKLSKELLLENLEFDSVTSLVASQKHPYWSFKLINNEAKALFPDESHLDRHQMDEDLRTTYTMDGSIYWSRVNSFINNKGDQYSGKIGGYIVNPRNAVDIDTELDFEFCEFLLSKGKHE